MNILESIRIALEALFSNKGRSALTMLGVIIGVLAVISLVAIGEGAKAYVSKELMGIGSNLLVITPGKAQTSGGPPMSVDSAKKLTYEDTEFLARRASVLKHVAPIVVGTGKVKYQNRSRDTTVLGVTYEFQQARNLHVEIGSFVSADDVDAQRRVCVLGRLVKQELFDESNPLGKMIKINDASFRVIGIMERKGVSFGFNIDDLVFIPVKTAQDLYDTDKIFEIMVAATSEKEVEEAKRQIIQLLTKRHGEEDFTITTQAAMLETMESILTTLTWVLGAIAGISLVVGGIGIMNIMLVSVSERTREIGIRKAVGAKRRDILSQFLVESITISAVGGLLGVLLGVSLSQGLAFSFPSLPVKVSLWSILLALSFSVFVGVFFGVYPARKASKLDPIEALRHE
ncbi:MAG: ABC transporter permease [Nitrospira sp.]|nr:ABC transporter permease [Nitrospira sp.]